MANPFLGEIRMFAGNFAPSGWQLCNGQLLSISQYTALFSLLGTNFGGNGTSNFALPNLQGMAPMHQGSGAGLTPRSVGETGGTTTVTLGAGSKGETNVLANQVNCDEASGSRLIYATTSDGSVMGAGMVQALPASQPHQNQQPFLCVNFIIAMTGIYPARN
jgi:microcystin-dependent protein